MRIPMFPFSAERWFSIFTAMFFRSCCCFLSPPLGVCFLSFLLDVTTVHQLTPRTIFFSCKRSCSCPKAKPASTPPRPIMILRRPSTCSCSVIQVRTVRLSLSCFDRPSSYLSVDLINLEVVVARGVFFRRVCCDGLRFYCLCFCLSRAFWRTLVGRSLGVLSWLHAFSDGYSRPTALHYPARQHAGKSSLGCCLLVLDHGFHCV